MLTTSYLINRVLTKILGLKLLLIILLRFILIQKHFPQFLWKFLDTQHLFILTKKKKKKKQNKTKLDPHALKCVFVGYWSTQKGYKYYDPISRKNFASMDVTFFENQPYFTKNTLQGENVLPLPTFDDNMHPNLSHSSSSIPIGLENLCSSSTSQPSSIISNNEELLTGGESLWTKSQTELRV